MGTSTSYRAPSRPRWQAFVTALTEGESLDRVRSELFNAGSEWREALADPAVASYAQSIADLHGALEAWLLDSSDVGTAVASTLAEARAASREAGTSAASAFAERAFAAVVIRGVDGITGGPDAVAEAVSSWSDRRGGDPSALVGDYLGEVLAQFSRHAVDREAGRLALRQVGVEASAALSDSLAQTAAAIGASAAAELESIGRSVHGAWTDAVSRAFEIGRELPPADR